MAVDRSGVCGCLRKEFGYGSVRATRHSTELIYPALSATMSGRFIKWSRKWGDRPTQTLISSWLSVWNRFSRCKHRGRGAIFIFCQAALASWTVCSRLPSFFVPSIFLSPSSSSLLFAMLIKGPSVAADSHVEILSERLGAAEGRRIHREELPCTGPIDVTRRLG